jgi:anti-sigma factor RsiW
MMTCFEAEELLLESVDEPLTGQAGRLLEGHVAGCAACAGFAARLRAVDATLAAALASPAISPLLAPAIRKRQRRERLRSMAGSLPDLIHFTGCGAATVISAALLPVESSITLGVGVAFTCVTYVFMAVLRSSLEASEQPDW